MSTLWPLALSAASNSLAHIGSQDIPRDWLHYFADGYDEIGKRFGAAMAGLIR